MGVRGGEGPEADGVVEGAGEEGIRSWTEGKGCYGSSVTFEVAQELVVVG